MSNVFKFKHALSYGRKLQELLEFVWAEEDCDPHCRFVC